MKSSYLYTNRRNKRTYTRSPNYEHVLQENCINAYVDGGNSIQAMWQYLRRLIDLGDITEPYAKEVAEKSLNAIKSAERIYNKILREKEI